MGIKFGADTGISEEMLVSDVCPVNDSILLTTLVIILLTYLKRYLS